MLLTHGLRIKWTIEVFAVLGTLCASHVASDDEVRSSKILPDDHVLNCLTRASHLHGVWEVGPTESITSPLLVERVLLQHLIGLDTSSPIDITWLRRSACRVHEDDGIRDILLSSNQELKVRLVHR